VFIGRRIHYTARENLFIPAGIVFHESYYQYYDPTDHQIADQAKNKALLGFSDIRATHEPDVRTLRFFADYLPKVLTEAGPRWAATRNFAYAYAKGEMNLAQLYTEIGSPAGGKWINQEDEPPFEPPY
jgi:hypothetical protein